MGRVRDGDHDARTWMQFGSNPQTHLIPQKVLLSIGWACPQKSTNWMGIITGTLFPFNFFFKTLIVSFLGLFYSSWSGKKSYCTFWSLVDVWPFKENYAWDCSGIWVDNVGFLIQYCWIVNPILDLYVNNPTSGSEPNRTKINRALRVWTELELNWTEIFGLVQFGS